MSPRTGVELVEEHSLAGVGSRVGARLIDSCINLSLVLCVSLIFRLLVKSGAWTPRGNPRAMWDVLGRAGKDAALIAFVVATGPIYYTLLHSSPWQATLGKRLLKIYVTGEDGRRIGLRRSFARWFACLALSWLNLLSLLTIVESRQHKAIHDFLVGTLVWRGQPQPAVEIEPWRIVACLGLPIVWILATFLLTFG